MRWIGIVFVLFFVASGLKAQDTLVSTLQVVRTCPADLDSIKVDSFFRARNIDLAITDNPQLYYEVYRWYRTCYRYGGQSDKGIDCSGFINMLYEKIYHKKLPRASYAMYPICRPLGKKEVPAEGDLVFFKIHKKRISHVGIYLQHGKFAHASNVVGVTISDLSEAYYKKYFYRAGRPE